MTRKLEKGPGDIYTGNILQQSWYVVQDYKTPATHRADMICV